MRKGQRKRYKKGFTLVEMIGTITILGIISLVALPVISNATVDFTKRKFENYEEALISAAKLYVDQNEDDLFGDADDGCSDVGFSEIISKNLIEDIELEGATCAGSLTYVRVQKKGSAYEYSPSITCTLNGEVAYQKKLDPASTCLPVGDVVDPEDPDPPGGYVPTVTSITSDPRSSDTPAKTKMTTILISDEKGFAPNAKIRYYWINTSNHNAVVGGKKEKNFKNALIRTSHTFRLKVSTPNTTGDLKLVVEPINVINGDGREITQPYTSEVFKIDNTPPVVVIKAYQERGGNKIGGVIRQANNTNLVITDWRNHGYYFDFTGSSDNYGAIVKETWEWNKINNVHMVENHAGGSSTYPSVTNTTFTGHGARYGTVTLCDTANNCTSKNVKVNISTVYKIKYDKNSGSGSMGNTTCYYGIDCRLSGNNFSRTGYSFSKWKIGRDKYNAGSNVKSLSDKEGGEVTAYAQWNVNYYTVRYYVNDSKGYNGIWTTRSVPYGGNIDAGLSPQGSINKFRRFDGWNNNPGRMPAHDVTLNARISDYLCKIITGHEDYDHVHSFIPKFNAAGYWNTHHQDVEGGYSQIVTDQDMTYDRAVQVFNYVWDHTPHSYGTYFLVWGMISCNNDYSTTRCREWACG